MLKNSFHDLRTGRSAAVEIARSIVRFTPQSAALLLPKNDTSSVPPQDSPWPHGFAPVRKSSIYEVHGSPRDPIPTAPSTLFEQTVNRIELSITSLRTSLGLISSAEISSGPLTIP